MGAAVAGDLVRHSLGRLWAVVPTAKLVALQIGTNDHASLNSDRVKTLEGIARVVAKASRLVPDAVILLVAISPTPDAARYEKNQLANSLIATLADGGRVRFVDPTPLVDRTDPE